jgi:hypothetical protein
MTCGRDRSGPANLATIRAVIKDADYLHVSEGARNHCTPPKPSTSTALIRTETGIHGTRRIVGGTATTYLSSLRRDRDCRRGVEMLSRPPL